MIKNGTLVRFIGNDLISKIAEQYEVDDWSPDDIPANTIGICEKVAAFKSHGFNIYWCRFPINSYYRTSQQSYISICEHFNGRFYEFEIEEVL